MKPDWVFNADPDFAVGLATEAELAQFHRAGFVRIVTWGSPRDPFVRVVDELERAGGVLTSNRRVLCRQPLRHIELRIEVRP